jgi:hypothetical protein
MNPYGPAAPANILLAYQQTTALIVTVTASPNPTYSENGRSVPKAEYLSMLVDKQEALLKAYQMATGSFDIYG